MLRKYHNLTCLHLQFPVDGVRIEAVGPRRASLSVLVDAGRSQLSSVALKGFRSFSRLTNSFQEFETWTSR